MHKLCPAVMEHTDPFLVAIGNLNLQIVVHSSEVVSTTIKMVTTELLLHLGEEVV